MEITKFCKICLVQGVKMFSTQGYLDEYLKDLLGHRLLYSSDVPLFVCYECASLLKKCIKFKEKCLHGQHVLFEILEDKNEITKEDILSVDRIKINLVSSLTVGPITKDHYFAFNQDETYSDEMDDTFDSDNEPLQPVSKEKQNDQLLDHNFEEEARSISEDEEIHNKCTICKKILSDSGMCVLKEHELKQIKNISLQLKDGLINLMNSADDIKIHTKCKKKYYEKYVSTEKHSKYDKRKPVLSKSKTDADNTLQITEKINNSTTEAANGTVELEPMDCEYAGEKNIEIQERNDNRMKYCVICHEDLLDESYVVKSEELETFKKFSLLHEDGLYNYFSSVNEVYVHDKCQEAYTTEGDNKYLKYIFSSGSCMSSKENDMNLKHQKCVICRGTRKDVFNNLKTVALERLKKNSLVRNDGLFHYFNSINEISIHDNCRVNYNRINPKYLGPLKLIPKSCQSDPNSAASKTIGRRRIVYGPKKEFNSKMCVDYERECFICTRQLRPTLEMKLSSSKRRVVNTVTDPECKEKIITQLRKIKTSPEYSDYKNVNKTIERISKLDLVGIGAKCHMDCYNDILNPRPNKQVVKPYINKVMNTIFKYIEEVGEDSEFTLSELTSILKKSDVKPNNTTIKTHLRNRYKDRITLIRVRHDTVIVFNE